MLCISSIIRREDELKKKNKDLRADKTGKIMKTIKGRVLALTCILFISGIINAQDVKVNPDTATVRAQQKEQQVQEQNRNREQAQNQAQEQNQTQAEKQSQGQGQPTADNQAGAQNQGAGASGIKKVQSARPDWSRARGARPASIERPSGSRIPKGAGKPGGAKGPGRR